MKRTDRWYPDQPEWGTPESTEKAKQMTPGEKTKTFQRVNRALSEADKVNIMIRHILGEEMTSADAGIPQDTKDMGPDQKKKRKDLFKTEVVTDRRLRADKHPVLRKKFRQNVG